MSHQLYARLPLHAVLYAGHVTTCNESHNNQKNDTIASCNSELISTANALLSSQISSNDLNVAATCYNRSLVLLSRPILRDPYIQQLPLGRLLFAAHLSSVMRSQIFSGLAKELHTVPLPSASVVPVPNIVIRKRLPPSSSASAAAAAAASLANSQAKGEIRSLTSTSALEQSLADMLGASESELLSTSRLNVTLKNKRAVCDSLTSMIHADLCAATLIPSDRSRILVNELLHRHHVLQSSKQQQHIYQALTLDSKTLLASLRFAQASGRLCLLLFSLSICFSSTYLLACDENKESKVAQLASAAEDWAALVNEAAGLDAQKRAVEKEFADFTQRRKEYELVLMQQGAAIQAASSSATVKNNQKSSSTSSTTNNGGTSAHPSSSIRMKIPPSGGPNNLRSRQSIGGANGASGSSGGPLDLSHSSSVPLIHSAEVSITSGSSIDEGGAVVSVAVDPLGPLRSASGAALRSKGVSVGGALSIVGVGGGKFKKNAAVVASDHAPTASSIKPRPLTLPPTANVGVGSGAAEPGLDINYGRSLPNFADDDLKHDSSVALALQLNAESEAFAKSEASYKEQIDRLSAMHATLLEKCKTGAALFDSIALNLLGNVLPADTSSLKPSSDVVEEQEEDGVQYLSPSRSKQVEVESKKEYTWFGEASGETGSRGQTWQALKESAHNTVLFCGQNVHGELGTGDVETRKELVESSALFGHGVVSIAAGNEHTLVTTAFGEALSCGFNESGQCGRESSMQASAIDGGRKSMSLRGKDFGTVLFETTPQKSNSSQPIKVRSSSRSMRIESAHAFNGCEHSFFLSQGGQDVFGVGNNARYQLGVGHSQPQTTPIKIRMFLPEGRNSSLSPTPLRVRHVACSYYNTIFVAENGAVFGTGRNDCGQLGRSNLSDVREPTLLIPLHDSTYRAAVGLFGGRPDDSSSNSISSSSVYATITSSSSNIHEENINSSDGVRSPPLLIRRLNEENAASPSASPHNSSSGSSYPDSSSSHTHNSAIASDTLPATVQEALAFRNALVQSSSSLSFRSGGASSSTNPSELSHQLSRYSASSSSLPDGGCWIRSVSVGQFHTVLVLSDGRCYSTGKNDWGQSGLGVSGCTRAFTRITSGALSSPTENEKDRLLEAETGKKPLLVLPSSDIPVPIIAASCGYYHTLLLTSSGGVISFGRNDSGTCGVGTTELRVTLPRFVSLPQPATIIAAGCYHSVACTGRGLGQRVFSWGRNQHGQCGLGDLVERVSPAEIKIPGNASPPVPVREIASRPFRASKSLPLPLPLLLDTMNKDNEAESNDQSTRSDSSTLVMNVSSVALGFYHSSFLLSAVPSAESGNEQASSTAELVKAMRSSEGVLTMPHPSQHQGGSSNHLLSAASIATEILRGLVPMPPRLGRQDLNVEIVPVLSSSESVSNFNEKCASLSALAIAHRSMRKRTIAASRTPLVLSSVESTPLRPLTKLPSSAVSSLNATPARSVADFATPRMVSISFASGTDAPLTPLQLPRQLAASLEDSAGASSSRSSNLVVSILAEERSARLSNERNSAMPVQPIIRTRSQALASACAPIYSTLVIAQRLMHAYSCQPGSTSLISTSISRLERSLSMIQATTSTIPHLFVPTPHTLHAVTKSIVSPPSLQETRTSIAACVHLCVSSIVFLLRSGHGHELESAISLIRIQLGSAILPASVDGALTPRQPVSLLVQKSVSKEAWAALSLEYSDDAAAYLGSFATDLDDDDDDDNNDCYQRRSGGSSSNNNVGWSSPDSVFEASKPPSLTEPTDAARLIMSACIFIAEAAFSSDHPASVFSHEAKRAGCEGLVSLMDLLVSNPPEALSLLKTANSSLNSLYATTSVGIVEESIFLSCSISSVLTSLRFLPALDFRETASFGDDLVAIAKEAWKLQRTLDIASGSTKWEIIRQRPSFALAGSRLAMHVLKHAAAPVLCSDEVLRSPLGPTFNDRNAVRKSTSTQADSSTWQAMNESDERRLESIISSPSDPFKELRNHTEQEGIPSSSLDKLIDDLLGFNEEIDEGMQMTSSSSSSLTSDSLSSSARKRKILSRLVSDVATAWVNVCGRIKIEAEAVTGRIVSALMEFAIDDVKDKDCLVSETNSGTPRSSLLSESLPVLLFVARSLSTSCRLATALSYSCAMLSRSLHALLNVHKCEWTLTLSSYAGCTAASLMATQLQSQLIVPPPDLVHGGAPSSGGSGGSASETWSVIKSILSLSDEGSEAFARSSAWLLTPALFGSSTGGLSRAASTRLISSLGCTAPLPQQEILVTQPPSLNLPRSLFPQIATTLGEKGSWAASTGGGFSLMPPSAISSTATSPYSFNFIRLHQQAAVIVTDMLQGKNSARALLDSLRVHCVESVPGYNATLVQGKSPLRNARSLVWRSVVLDREHVVAVVSSDAEAMSTFERAALVAFLAADARLLSLPAIAARVEKHAALVSRANAGGAGSGASAASAMAAASALASSPKLPTWLLKAAMHAAKLRSWIASIRQAWPKACTVMDIPSSDASSERDLERHVPFVAVCEEAWKRVLVSLDFLPELGVGIEGGKQPSSSSSSTLTSAITNKGKSRWRRAYLLVQAVCRFRRCKFLNVDPLSEFFGAVKGYVSGSVAFSLGISNSVGGKGAFFNTHKGSVASSMLLDLPSAIAACYPSPQPDALRATALAVIHINSMRAAGLQSLALLTSCDNESIILAEVFDAASSAVEKCRGKGEIFRNRTSRGSVLLSNIQGDGFPPLSLLPAARVFLPTLAPVLGYGEVGFGGSVSSSSQMEIGLSALSLFNECADRRALDVHGNDLMFAGASRLLSLLVSTVAAHSPVSVGFSALSSAFETSLQRYSNSKITNIEIGGRLEDLELCRIILSSLCFSSCTENRLLSLRGKKALSLLKRLVRHLLSFINKDSAKLIPLLSLLLPYLRAPYFNVGVSNEKQPDGSIAHNLLSTVAFLIKNAAEDKAFSHHTSIAWKLFSQTLMMFDDKPSLADALLGGCRCCMIPRTSLPHGASLLLSLLCMLSRSSYSSLCIKNNAEVCASRLGEFSFHSVMSCVDSGFGLGTASASLSESIHSFLRRNRKWSFTAMHFILESILLPFLKENHESIQRSTSSSSIGAVLNSNDLSATDVEIPKLSSRMRSTPTRVSSLDITLTAESTHSNFNSMTPHYLAMVRAVAVVFGGCVQPIRPGGVACTTIARISATSLVGLASPYNELSIDEEIETNINNGTSGGMMSVQSLDSTYGWAGRPHSSNSPVSLWNRHNSPSIFPHSTLDNSAGDYSPQTIAQIKAESSEEGLYEPINVLVVGSSNSSGVKGGSREEPRARVLVCGRYHEKKINDTNGVAQDILDIGSVSQSVHHNTEKLRRIMYKSEIQRKESVETHESSPSSTLEARSSQMSNLLATSQRDPSFSVRGAFTFSGASSSGGLNYLSPWIIDVPTSALTPRRSKSLFDDCDNESEEENDDTVTAKTIEAISNAQSLLSFSSTSVSSSTTSLPTHFATNPQKDTISAAAVSYLKASAVLAIMSTLQVIPHRILSILPSNVINAVLPGILRLAGSKINIPAFVALPDIFSSTHVLESMVQNSMMRSSSKPSSFKPWTILMQEETELKRVTEREVEKKTVSSMSSTEVNLLFPPSVNLEIESSAKVEEISDKNGNDWIDDDDDVERSDDRGDDGDKDNSTKGFPANTVLENEVEVEEDEWWSEVRLEAYSRKGTSSTADDAALVEGSSSTISSTNRLSPRETSPRARLSPPQQRPSTSPASIHSMSIGARRSAAATSSITLSPAPAASVSSSSASPIALPRSTSLEVVGRSLAAGLSGSTASSETSNAAASGESVIESNNNNEQVNVSEPEESENEAGSYQNSLSVLESMGFDTNWCATALTVTGNDLDLASSWIVDHLDLLNAMKESGLGLEALLVNGIAALGAERERLLADDAILAERERHLNDDSTFEPRENMETQDLLSQSSRNAIASSQLSRFGFRQRFHPSSNSSSSSSSGGNNVSQFPRQERVCFILDLAEAHSASLSIVGLTTTSQPSLLRTRQLVTWFEGRVIAVNLRGALLPRIQEPSAPSASFPLSSSIGFVPFIPARLGNALERVSCSTLTALEACEEDFFSMDPVLQSFHECGDGWKKAFSTSFLLNSDVSENSTSAGYNEESSSSPYVNEGATKEDDGSFSVDVDEEECEPGNIFEGIMRPGRAVLHSRLVDRRRRIRRNARLSSNGTISSLATLLPPTLSSGSVAVPVVDQRSLSIAHSSSSSSSSATGVSLTFSLSAADVSRGMDALRLSNQEVNPPFLSSSSLSSSAAGLTRSTSAAPLMRSTATATNSASAQTPLMAADLIDSMHEAEEGNPALSMQVRISSASSSRGEPRLVRSSSSISLTSSFEQTRGAIHAPVVASDSLLLASLNIPKNGDQNSPYRAIGGTRMLFGSSNNIFEVLQSPVAIAEPRMMAIIRQSGVNSSIEAAVRYASYIRNAVASHAESIALSIGPTLSTVMLCEQGPGPISNSGGHHHLGSNTRGQDGFDDLVKKILGDKSRVETSFNSAAQGLRRDSDPICTRFGIIDRSSSSLSTANFLSTLLERATVTRLLLSDPSTLDAPDLLAASIAAANVSAVMLARNLLPFLVAKMAFSAVPMTLSLGQTSSHAHLSVVVVNILENVRLSCFRRTGSQPALLSTSLDAFMNPTPPSVKEQRWRGGMAVVSTRPDDGPSLLRSSAATTLFNFLTVSSSSDKLLMFLLRLFFRHLTVASIGGSRGPFSAEAWGRRSSWEGDVSSLLPPPFCGLDSCTKEEAVDEALNNAVNNSTNDSSESGIDGPSIEFASWIFSVIRFTVSISAADHVVRRSLTELTPSVLSAALRLFLSSPNVILRSLLSSVVAFLCEGSFCESRQALRFLSKLDLAITASSSALIETERGGSAFICSQKASILISAAATVRETRRNLAAKYLSIAEKNGDYNVVKGKKEAQLTPIASNDLSIVFIESNSIRLCFGASVLIPSSMPSECILVVQARIATSERHQDSTSPEQSNAAFKLDPESSDDDSTRLDSFSEMGHILAEENCNEGLSGVAPRVGVAKCDGSGVCRKDGWHSIWALSLADLSSVIECESVTLSSSVSSHRPIFETTVVGLSPSTTYLFRVVKKFTSSAVLPGAKNSSSTTSVVAARTSLAPPLSWDSHLMGPGIVIMTADDSESPAGSAAIAVAAAASGSSVSGAVHGAAASSTAAAATAPLPSSISNGRLSGFQARSCAHYAGVDAWSLVLGSRGFSSGLNSWAIRIDRTPSAFLFIGVATKFANFSHFLGSDECGWGYLGDRALYHRHTKTATLMSRFGAGDVVGVDLDMDCGTLSFTVNGVPQGVAFKNLTGQLFPAVAFYSHGQRVTLLSRASGLGCSGSGVNSPGIATPTPLVEDVVRFMTLSKALKSSSSVLSPPKPVLRSAFSAFKRSLSGNDRRVLTKSGCEISIDTSPSVMDEYCGGLRAGDRVLCAQGEGEILGVSSKRPWLRIDEDSNGQHPSTLSTSARGAWFTDPILKDEHYGSGGRSLNSSSRSDPIDVLRSIAAASNIISPHLGIAGNQSLPSFVRTRALGHILDVRSPSSSSRYRVTGGEITAGSSSTGRDESAKSIDAALAVESALSSLAAASSESMRGQSLESAHINGSSTAASDDATIVPSTSIGSNIIDENYSQRNTGILVVLSHVSRDRNSVNQENDGETSSSSSRASAPLFPEISIGLNFLSSLSSSDSSSLPPDRSSAQDKRKGWEDDGILPSSSSSSSFLKKEDEEQERGSKEAGLISTRDSEKSLPPLKESLSLITAVLTRVESLQRFLAICSGAHNLFEVAEWKPVIDDSRLVNAINRFSDSSGRNPYNLIPSTAVALFMAETDDHLDYTNMSNESEDSMSSHQSSCTSECENLAKSLSPFAATSSLSSHQTRWILRVAVAGCRLFLLREWNDLVSLSSISQTSPLSDLLDVKSESTSDPPFSLLCYSPTMTIVEGASSVTAAPPRIQRLPRLNIPSSTLLLGDLRSLLFSTTMRGMFFRSIFYSRTVPRRTEDEYEYPSDLPVVTVDRPLAIGYALPSNDPKIRLFGSVFGQVHQSLRSLGGPPLRLFFQHPMDDGQVRAFRVKLSGEASDDYSGLYRELFAHICNELQTVSTFSSTRKGAYATSSTDKSQDGECVRACLVPLLRPIGPILSVGSSTSGNMTQSSLYTLRAGRALTESEEDALTSLGRLLGIALRTRTVMPLNFHPRVWSFLVGETGYEEEKEIMEDALHFNASSTPHRITAMDLSAVERDILLEDPDYVRTLRAHQTAALDLEPLLSPEAIDSRHPVPGFEDVTWELADLDSVSSSVDYYHCGYQSSLSFPAVSVADAASGRFRRAALLARLHCSDTALRCLRRGFIEVIPAASLPLLSGKILRGLICGAESVDLSLLRANTEYDEGISETDNHVQWLWKVLESFNTDQRKKFLRFVWARDSLPSASTDFNQRFRVQASVPMSGDATISEVAAAAMAARSGAGTSRGSRNVSQGSRGFANSNEMIGMTTRRVSSSTDHDTRSSVSSGSRGSSAGLALHQTSTGSATTAGYDLVNTRSENNPSMASLSAAASAAREALLDIDMALASAITRSNAQGEISRAAMLERVPPSMRSQILRATSRPGSAAVLSAVISGSQEVGAQAGMQTPRSSSAAPARDQQLLHRSQSQNTNADVDVTLRATSSSIRQLTDASAVESCSEDARLPTSHTCFFSLHLPKYSSEEILRKRLLYAISNCVALDADYRLDVLPSS